MCNENYKLFFRTEMLLGSTSLERLRSARVAVFGIGGVGGYVCEALVRSGVGSFDLIDRDTVSESNINRQIIALHSTVGKYKAEVMRDRMLDINPGVNVRVHNKFFLPDNADEFPFEEYDYVADAVDTVSAKLELVSRAKRAGVPIISSMGAGNKLHGELFTVEDIFKTSVCPLARVMRRELKKRGIDSLKVVYSKETPLDPATNPDGGGAPAYGEELPEGKRSIPGSIAFVPSAAGLLMAGEIIRDLTGIR